MKNIIFFLSKYKQCEHILDHSFLFIHELGVEFKLDANVALAIFSFFDRVKMLQKPHRWLFFSDTNMKLEKTLINFSLFRCSVKIKLWFSFHFYFIHNVSLPRSKLIYSVVPDISRCMNSFLKQACQICRLMDEQSNNRNDILCMLALLKLNYSH